MFAHRFTVEANYKCLVIIGAQKNVENVKKRMRELRGGIEVRLACPRPCTYRLSSLCQARRLCFGLLHPKCDRVARSFTILKKRPFHQESSAQKLKFIVARLVCFDDDKPTSVPIFLNCLLMHNLLESCWSLPYSQDLLTERLAKTQEAF